jgi:transcriptional regulator with XRE-family HTH domain
MPTKREQFVQTIRAQWLGQRMRELREERGLTLKYIAAYLGVEFSTLARYERAEWPFRRDHVVALLDVYGVYDERERTQLVQLAQDAWRVNRWDDDFEGTVYDQTFVDYPWLESRSEEICTYSTMVFPGLLQTRDYAEAVIRYAEGAQANQQKIDRWVRLRMERQLILDEKPPKRLAALVEESVLHRQIGGRLVLRAQLEHLARAVERPHVEVRVVPTRIGLHGGLSGAFTLFKMQRPYPEVAYVEQLGGRLFMEASRAHRYSRAYDALREVALSAAESMALIATLAEELS